MSATDGAGDWYALNRANWDERTAVHLGPGGYDVSSQRAGCGRLDAISEAELGPVTGLRVLHLQCHIGDDSIAIAQRGAAEVVGVDFSPPAVQAAQALAAECGVANARFVLSDVLEAPAALPGEAGKFDLVFTTWAPSAGTRTSLAGGRWSATSCARAVRSTSPTCTRRPRCSTV
jgi:2-polyprenyl-3-methyl-5-hydroxy-6-metoxy-1,4-benzoquinol methylase